MNANVPVVLSAIDSLISSDFFKKGLTGRNGLRSSMNSKSHPLLRYVHRMVRFYSGIDPRIPTATQFYLQDFVDDLLNQDPKCKDNFLVYTLRDGVETIYDKLDKYSEDLCEYFGLDKNGCAKRWYRAFYG